MKELSVKIDDFSVKITVVPSKLRRTVLSQSELEMDKRAESAVKAAITKARICKKPIAKYDVASGKTVLE